ncbi:HNH endonuclease family protein [Streptomyces sp. ACA25]|uniref:HNH endonuclease family protein n=1 Tax=Streptomyces sp. ACA25 TaxID=3022596 RepID=UPI0023077878|nr:HNH endonuclease family protein [Streptomyces sp. ACA25]MDB1087097.1 HNH endonuclease family protein [Streptomyces sp. ACA25]
MFRPSFLPRGRRLSVLVTALAAALLFALLGPPASAAPPRIPSAAVAQTELNSLRVAAETSMAGYSRSLFPHWRTINGCSARQTVLKRDGRNVVVDGNCQPTSGTWFSQFDGVTLTSASQVDIDHHVPLAEAWRSGASSWSTDRRREFANDLYWPQLIAVSASSNRSKGDQDPADWKPRAAFHCTYSRMWIRAKYQWNLAVDPAEKSALQTMLNTC